MRSLALGVLILLCMCNTYNKTVFFISCRIDLNHFLRLFSDRYENILQMEILNGMSSFNNE